MLSAPALAVAAAQVGLAQAFLVAADLAGEFVVEVDVGEAGLVAQRLLADGLRDRFEADRGADRIEREEAARDRAGEPQHPHQRALARERRLECDQRQRGQRNRQYKEE